jgi:acetyl esterase/lipase
MPDSARRRELLLALLAAPFAPAASAALVPQAGASGPANERATRDVPLSVPAPTGPAPALPLWPAGPPGGVPSASGQALQPEFLERAPAGSALRDRIVRHVTQPCLYPFIASRPNGLAALILPGGGYRHVVVDKEGFESAEWLAARGVNAYVLMYRLPADGWQAGTRAPLEDAQRALALVRDRARRDGHAADRVFAQGFSAGGHLAAWLATGGGNAKAPRPDAAALLYPVMKMADPYAHAGSPLQLLGPHPQANAVEASEPDRLVDAATPPVWLAHALDDTAVPPENGEAFVSALRKSGRRVEAHYFEDGGHGFGLRYIAGKTVAAWPQLCLDWVLRVLPAR